MVGITAHVACISPAVASVIIIDTHISVLPRNLLTEPILHRFTAFLIHSMAKRTTDSDDSPHRKRQKITKTSTPAKERYEIRSSRDLQLMLAFDQDIGPVVRQSKNH